jgi:hypothetical protein
MAREKGKREPQDIVLNLGLGLCCFAGMFLLIAMDYLSTRASIRLECTREKDCFLTEASWFTREVVHFREPALKGAEVAEAHHHRRGTPLGTYRPVLRVDGHYSYPLWHAHSSNRQDAEADAARVVAWKAAPDAAPLRMEHDRRGAMTRLAAHTAGWALLPLGLGGFLVYRRTRRPPRSTPSPQPRRGGRRDKRGR